jgi:hypothetical protein
MSDLELMVATAVVRDLEEALRCIAAETYVCEQCGVEYVAGYQGACQEPAPGARWHDQAARWGDWSAYCPGEVSAQGTARRALRKGAP